MTQGYAQEPATTCGDVDLDAALGTSSMQAAYIRLASDPINALQTVAIGMMSFMYDKAFSRYTPGEAC